MRRRHAPRVPPPERATWADYYRIGLGAIMIPLGITILVRTFSAGIVTPPAVLMGGAFIVYGAYRLYVGIVRYRMYRMLRLKRPDAGRETGENRQG